MLQNARRELLIKLPSIKLFQKIISMVDWWGGRGRATNRNVEKETAVIITQEHFANTFIYTHLE